MHVNPVPWEVSLFLLQLGDCASTVTVLVSQCESPLPSLSGVQHSLSVVTSGEHFPGCWQPYLFFAIVKAFVCYSCCFEAIIFLLVLLFFPPLNFLANTVRTVFFFCLHFMLLSPAQFTDPTASTNLCINILIRYEDWRPFTSLKWLVFFPSLQFKKRKKKTFFFSFRARAAFMFCQSCQLGVYCLLRMVGQEAGGMPWQAKKMYTGQLFIGLRICLGFPFNTHLSHCHKCPSAAQKSKSAFECRWGENGDGGGACTWRRSKYVILSSESINGQGWIDGRTDGWMKERLNMLVFSTIL